MQRRIRSRRTLGVLLETASETTEKELKWAQPRKRRKTSTKTTLSILPQRQPSKRLDLSADNIAANKFANFKRIEELNQEIGRRELTVMAAPNRSESPDIDLMQAQLEEAKKKVAAKEEQRAAERKEAEDAEKEVEKSIKKQKENLDAFLLDSNAKQLNILKGFASFDQMYQDAVEKGGVVKELRKALSGAQEKLVKDLELEGKVQDEIVDILGSKAKGNLLKYLLQSQTFRRAIEQCDRYKVLEKGKSAMGNAWRAADSALNQEIVRKKV